MNNHHISKISGKEYTLSDRGKRLFNQELEENDTTMIQYIEKYFVNVGNAKYNRELEEGEHYLINRVNMSEYKYHRVIVHEQFKCDICDDFFATDMGGFLTHIKRIHKFDKFDEYLTHVGFKEEECEYKTCGFCGREAEYEVKYDHKNRTFIKIYPRYKCNNKECINDICLKFFGLPHAESIKKYEHIGGNTEYLKIIYQTDEEGLKLIGKSKAAKNPGRWRCNIDGFIEKYGIVDGFAKYDERCKKVGYGGTLDGYIQNYGEELGKEKYLDKINRQTERNKYVRVSKGQRKLFYLLCNLNIGEFVLEYPTIRGTPDIYDLKNNVIIEFFGDFWHCNPLVYPKDFYNRAIKMTMEQKHKFDRNRLENIKEELKCKKSIIVWEKSFNEIPRVILLEQIKTFIQSKLEGDLWI